MNTYLLQLKRSLAPQDLEILKIELERKKKSVVLAYLLWFWLSIFGLHKFYLGKIWQGLLYMIGPWVTIFSIFGGLIASVQPNAQGGGALATSVGGLGLLCFAIWWFVDLFTLHRQTERANEKIEKALLLQIKPDEMTEPKMTEPKLFEN